jgi:CheY-like chemotaxis protein
MDAEPARRHADRVLVVEDNDDARESLVLLLQAQGYDTDGVPNGLDALRVLHEGYDPSLILLDLMMPVMDGWSFRFEQCRDAELADIPVAVLSAALDPAQEAARMAAVAGLQKPLKLDELLDLVGQYCARRRADPSDDRP